jgi:starch synthase
VHIVFAASECVPFAKTGGLADVVGALPPELAKLGHKVSVFLPLYKTVRPFLPEQLKWAVRSVTIPFTSYNRFAGIVDGGVRDGVQYYFVDCPEMFDRDGLYGPTNGVGDYWDNAERFGLYCRAVLEASKILGVPDVFHVHDWQAALIPILLRSVYYFDPVFKSVGVVLTIHNAGYQGWFRPDSIKGLLLPWDLFTFDKVEAHDMFNWLKGGLVFSDYLTTVSETYAREIQTPEFGEGMQDILSRRHWDLRGILNGVDYAQWNPAHDSKLAAHYTPQDLSGKLECRKDLLHAFGLHDVPETSPVIGIVSRFATQKGFDFVAAIADDLMKRDIALVVLGSGEPVYENFFRNLAAANPAKVALQVKYDDTLAHKIEAGSDMFLMPSRYEPCGLNQIYSLKYGTVPIVRGTGGLEDTVEDWRAIERTGTGFKFHGYHPGDLLWAIDQAIWVFQNDKEGWKQLMLNGMAKDYAWEHPAREYQGVYEEVLRRRG